MSPQATPLKGRGYIPDPIGHKYNGFHLLAAARLSAPAAANLLKFLRSIWDQDQTGSCTGHGTAGGVDITMSAHDKPLAKPPAPRIIYALGRAIDRINPDVPLQDDGAMPNSVTRSLGLWGIALEGDVDGGRTADSPDYSSHLDAHVNDELKLGELESCLKIPLLGFNAIDEGQNKLTQYKQALSSGHTVMHAVAASGNTFQGFSDPNGSKVLDFCGTDFDHWIYSLGYRTNAKGEVEGLVGNSWSKRWGWNGLAWVSQKFILQGTSNLIVANLGV